MARYRFKCMLLGEKVHKLGEFTIEVETELQPSEETEIALHREIEAATVRVIGSSEVKE